jgi:hypothetical protein
LRHLLPLGLVLALLVGLAAPAAAVERAGLGDDFLISGPAALADETEPAVASNTTQHEYLVVWVDERDTNGYSSDIYGRRLSADGERLGPDFRVCGPNALRTDVDPAVAYSSVSHEYLVVWTDYRNQLERSTDIYGRRVALDGSLPARDFRISGRAAVAAVPALAYNPDVGQFLAAWEDRRNQETAGIDIYGVRLSAAGDRLGADRRISTGSDYEYRPAVAFSGGGNGYLAVWPDGRDYPTRHQDIYGRFATA